MRRFRIMQGAKRQIVIEGSGKFRIELLGEGSSAEILGALPIKRNENLNIEVEIRHKAKKTKSNTFIRAVAYDKANVILRAIIKIEKKAQKTEAFLRENILLLSPGAKAEAVPNLEIEADDVKASHAATIGRIDEEQLFYLMSRGLPIKKAEATIAHGFLAEVTNKIKVR